MGACKGEMKLYVFFGIRISLFTWRVLFPHNVLLHFCMSWVSRNISIRYYFIFHGFFPIFPPGVAIISE